MESTIRNPQSSIPPAGPAWVSAGELGFVPKRARRWHRRLAPRGQAKQVGREYFFNPIAPTIADLLNKAVPPEDLSGLTDQQQRQARRWIEVLKIGAAEISAKLRDGLGKTPAIEWFCTVRCPELGFGRIPPGTYRRRAKAWQLAAAGRKIASQAKRSGRPTGEGTRCSPEAWAYFQSLYFDENQPTAELCWKLTRNGARKRGWAWLSYSGCVARVRQIPKPVLIKAREGERAHETQCMPRIKRSYEDVAANACWSGDEKTLDFFVRVPDKKLGWRKARPILTAWLDVRSRTWTGWHIGLHANTDTILAAFKMGVEQYGPPHEVYCDNGRDYKATAGRKRKWSEFDEACLTGVYGMLDIKVTWAIPYHSWSKMIESHFRAVDRELGKLLFSYTGSSTDTKPERLRTLGVMDCPTLDEAREAFGLFANAFHAKAKQGNGMHGFCPNQAMARFRGPTARQKLSGAHLDYLCARRVGPVKVSRRGVRWQGIYYGQGCEQLYLRQGREVWLRVMPDRADFVWVCDENDVVIVAAEQHRLAGTGAAQEHIRESNRQRKRLRRVTREYLARLPSIAIHDNVSATLQALREENEADQIATQHSAPDTQDTAVQLVRPDVQQDLDRLSNTESARVQRRSERRPGKIDFGQLNAALGLGGAPLEVEPPEESAGVDAASILCTGSLLDGSGGEPADEEGDQAAEQPASAFDVIRRTRYA